MEIEGENYGYNKTNYGASYGNGGNTGSGSRSRGIIVTLFRKLLMRMYMEANNPKIIHHFKMDNPS